MSTLEALGFNVLIYSSVAVFSFAAFSVAVRCGFNAQLAPRTWARPRNVVRNVIRPPYGLMWIPWALNLRYVDMLEGIEGTGTRKQGWAGAKLKCNLDAIVLIKFHALCYKVSLLATFLCMVIVFPLNWTVGCNGDVVGNEVCAGMANLTNFENTTLAHIPPMGGCHSNQCASLSEENTENYDASWEDWSNVPERVQQSLDTYFLKAPGVTWRLFLIVVVAWCIYIYTCKLIWDEWIQNLNLRRAYYLEANHFKNRQEEVDYLSSLQDPEDPLQEDRPLYLPHPELRETVPSVCLYSVLYKLPERFATPRATSPSSSTDNTSSNLDQQLAATVDFFHRCIPSQPGFSSSVAAATILPDSKLVSMAWKKWYACTSKLRRLRFIRQRLRQIRQQMVEEEEITPFAHENINSSSAAIPLEIINKKEEELPKVDTSLFTGVITNQNADNKSKGSSQGEHNGDSNSSDIIMDQERNDGGTKSDVMLSQDTVLIDSHTLFADANNPKDNMGKRPSEPMDGLEWSEPVDVDLEQGDTMSLHNIRKAKNSEMKMQLENGAIGSIDADLENYESTGDLENGKSSRTRPCKSDSSSILLPGPARQRLLFLSGRAGLQNEQAMEEILADNGFEQLAVYCREFAQSSGSCCPYGADAFCISRMVDIDRLEQLEDEAEEAILEAQQLLAKARDSVTQHSIVHSSVSPTLSTQLSGVRARELTFLDEIEEGEEEEVQDFEKEQSDVERVPGQINRDIRRRKSTVEMSWQIASDLTKDSQRSKSQRRYAFSKQNLVSGRWHAPTIYSFKISVYSTIRRILSWRVFRKQTNPLFGQSTYAVVTFTSRQAAIAARQCLADANSEVDRWIEIGDIPVPPLADTPPWNLLDFRGLCRPVTFTITEHRKRSRRHLTIFFLACFCVLYTLPLAALSSLLSADSLGKLFPESAKHLSAISSILTGSLTALFLTVCPYVFKALANYGGNAASLREAEYKAIRYYWFFILVSAFAGNSLANMITTGLTSEFNLGEQTAEVMTEVARSIPTKVSWQWLSWLVVKVGTNTMGYLLQINTFLFSMCGMKCCARLVAGGGPGAALPFRIYVDCGFVLLCILALAPVCPLVAPAGAMYFLLFSPMIRWLLIFVYRPEYDGGGLRWPLLHDMCISAMIMAQVLLTTMMVLKYAYGPAIMAGLPIYFTLQFSGITKSRFMRCYEDSGLIQTCELDGWDRSKRTSKEIREEFRKWLTDCHKASFVPICLAGIDNLITVEPSKVVPTERDEDDKERFRDPLIAPMNHVQRGERISFSPTKQPSLIPSI